MNPIAIACDGEFTSFDKIGGDLIKWAMIEILEDFTLGREKEWSLKAYSTKHFTEGAQKVHGISYWQASQFPERLEVLREIWTWTKEISPDPIPLVYHGTGNLDPAWLRHTFMKEDLEPHFWTLFGQETESTLSLARKNLKALPNHKLNTVADHYGIELDHHDALSDARACALIYCNIKKGLKTFTGEFNFET